MANLEDQVRGALIEQRTNELVETASKTPGYTEMIMALAGELGESMINSMAESLKDMDEEERQETINEFKEQALPQIIAQFENPELLRKQMHEQAKNQYLSYAEFRAKIAPHFEELKTEGNVDPGLIGKYAQSYERLTEFIKTHDKIVNGLTKVAEKEGIEKAVDKETRYAILREIFPTADSYRAFNAKGQIALKQFLQQAQDALVQDEEAGQMMAGIFGALSKVIDKAQKFSEKINGNYLEKTIQEMYK